MLAFVDASAWIAILNARDKYHLAALRYFRSIARERLLTSNYVLAEACTWLNYRRQHNAALQLNNMVVNSEKLNLMTVAWVTREVHDAAWGEFVRYDDQQFSFQDCTSLVICKRERVDVVFSFDSNFSTMGFDVKP